MYRRTVKKSNAIVERSAPVLQSELRQLTIPSPSNKPNREQKPLVLVELLQCFVWIRHFCILYR